MKDNYKLIKSLVDGYKKTAADRYLFVGGTRDGNMLQVPNQPERILFEYDQVYAKKIGMKNDADGPREFVYYQLIDEESNG